MEDSERSLKITEYHDHEISQKIMEDHENHESSCIKDYDRSWIILLDLSGSCNVMKEL